MKRTFTFLLALGVFISGCTFNVEVLTPEVPTPTLESPTPTTISWTPTSVSTLIPTIPPIYARQTPLPGAGSQFFNARFTLDPATSLYQNIFPANTKRIYAVWQYRNMRAGLKVRRDWYYNNALWISHEEPWDFAKYGADGTMSHISVYELEDGLLPGDYRFELYIDSQPQPIFGGVYWPSFKITVNEFSEQTISPNGSWIALVHEPALLSIVDPNGNVQDMFSGTEVVHLLWLADGKHLVFIDRDRSKQNAAGIGILDDIWIIDVETSQASMLYKDNAAIMQPWLASPGSGSGYYLAGAEGSGLGDGCGIDARVVFFEISEDFQAGQRRVQGDFAGLSSALNASAYPIGQGRWLSNWAYEVPLDFTCGNDPTLKGTYVFELGNLGLEKVK
jgi:hypothetical protein